MLPFPILTTMVSTSLLALRSFGQISSHLKTVLHPHPFSRTRSLHPDDERVEIPLHPVSAVGFEPRVFAAICAQGASVGHLLQIGHRLPEEIESVDEEDGAVGVFGRLDGTVDGGDLGHVVEGRVE